MVATRPTGKTYLLYSLGPDARDDGGKPMIDTQFKPPDCYMVVKQDETGDIVAGVNY